MEIAGNSNARDLHRLFTAAKRKPWWTSGLDLGQWASPPGEAIRSYLATPDLHLRLVAYQLTAQTSRPYSRLGWAREEVTANECLGIRVQEKMNAFFDGLTHRKDE